MSLSCIQGHCCFPVFTLVRCHWVRLFTVQLNWPNSAAKGWVSQAHDCLSAGKQAVCAKWSGHRSWKIRPNPCAVGLRRLRLWKCSWAIIKAYFSRDAGMLGNCIYFDFNVLLFCILTQNNTFLWEPEFWLEPGNGFKINLVSQRSPSLIAVRNHFPYLYLQFLRESWAYLGKVLAPCFYHCFGIRWHLAPSLCQPLDNLLFPFFFQHDLYDPPLRHFNVWNELPHLLQWTLRQVINCSQIYPFFSLNYPLLSPPSFPWF